jgi:hypothetical protein
MQSSFGRILLATCRRKKRHPPKWVIAHLGDDQNWWLDEVSSDIHSGEGSRGLLDPRQIDYLLKTLEEYRPHGYDSRLFNVAFQSFRVESELDDDRLRLAPVDQNIGQSSDQRFALPLTGDYETGLYYEFLDAITAARIRRLNATHHYARQCTDWEMQEELDALDRDRYSASEDIHCFDEIEEIIQWSPAEWNDSSSV